jgi:drug/metabolite transporter (DMT)-like permease
VSAVFFGVLAGALFGVFTLAVRAGLMRGADPEAGALVITGLGFLTGAALALPELASGIDPSDLWPFFLVGAIVPGVSQILFILAVRDAGPSRAAILIGTAPLISVLIALLVLDEPFRPLLLAGTALIVAGGVILVRERARPSHFRMLGAVLALTCAALFAVRDNAVRYVARGADAPPLAASAASLLGASTVVLLYLLIVRRHGLRVKLRAALPAFGAAGVTLGLAYASLVEGFDRGRVSVVAPLNATQSLWAVMLAAVLIGRSEHIGRRTVLSGVLVLAGGATISVLR